MNLSLIPNPDRVRMATEADADAIVELCRRSHAETGLGMFSEGKVRDVMRRTFDQGRNDIGVIGVVGSETIEGSIGLVVDSAWDSETVILRGLWNYVLPQYRASSNFRDLTAFARRLAEPAPVGMGLPVVMETVSTHRTEACVRLYTRQLGQPVAITWICEATYGGMH